MEAGESRGHHSRLVALSARPGDPGQDGGPAAGRPGAGAVAGGARGTQRSQRAGTAVPTVHRVDKETEPPAIGRRSGA